MFMVCILCSLFKCLEITLLSSKFYCLICQITTSILCTNSTFLLLFLLIIWIQSMRMRRKDTSQIFFFKIMPCFTFLWLDSFLFLQHFIKTWQNNMESFTSRSFLQHLTYLYFLLFIKWSMDNLIVKMNLLFGAI